MKFLAGTTLLNVLTALGFSTAAVISPESILPPDVTITSAATTFALYAVARSFALTLLVIAAIARRKIGPLLWLAALAGLIQVLDAAIGIYQSDITKSIGPLMLAVLQFWAIWRIGNSPERAKG